MYVNLLVLCVAIYFFRGQFTSVIYSVSSTSAFIARQVNYFINSRIPTRIKVNWLILTKQKEKSNGNEVNLFYETLKQISLQCSPFFPSSIPLPLSTPATQAGEFYNFFVSFRMIAS